MKNQMQKKCLHTGLTALAVAALAIAALPVLAERVDVSVIGTILPNACVPNLAGGGTIDYGAIHPSHLNAVSHTVLTEKNVDFTIVCDAPAKIAIRATNGRPATMAGVTEAAHGAAQTPVTVFSSAGEAGVGLGLAPDSAKIGGYGLRIQPNSVLADDAAVDTIYSHDNGVTWQTTNVGSVYHHTDIREITWAATGTTTPIAFTTLSGKLSAHAYLNNTTELNVVSPIVLDGYTTLELVYL
ncbi:MAG: DUF1120 domain-containing protein [Enterobacteriaceae bacterium]|jgi:type 1 fimbria pilin|nr:DUF1120 domain-containing protein [Enterobacteriaceae bacterium]